LFLPGAIGEEEVLAYVLKILFFISIRFEAEGLKGKINPATRLGF
jgi:hypothetical protein